MTAAVAPDSPRPRDPLQLDRERHPWVSGLLTRSDMPALHRRGLALSLKSRQGHRDDVGTLVVQPQALIFSGMAPASPFLTPDSGEGDVYGPCRTRQAVPCCPRGLASLPRNRDLKSIWWVGKLGEEPAVAQGKPQPGKGGREGGGPCWGPCIPWVGRWPSAPVEVGLPLEQALRRVEPSKRKGRATFGTGQTVGC